MGKILRQRIDQQGLSVTEVAENLGITRQTLYRYFDNEVVNKAFLMDVGKVIGYDFRKDISDMDFAHAAAEPEQVYGRPTTSEEAAAQLADLHKKYLSAHRTYTELVVREQLATH